MDGLGLEQGEAGDGQPAAGDTDAEHIAAAPQPARRMQRYRKLSTLSAAQLRGIDQMQLYSLLASGHQQQQEGQQQARQRVGVKSTAAAAGAGAGAGAERAVQQLQAGQAARYEHIRRRRGLSAFTITEQSADPLQHLASVYDVVRHEPQAGPAGSEAKATGEQDGVAAAAAQQQHQGRQHQQHQHRRPSRAQRAAQQYDEGTLLCNYLPMIREYLQAQGRQLPDPAAQQAGQGAAGGSQEAPAGMEEDGGSGSDGEYVYDLYAVVDDVPEGQAQEEGWWELHTSGHAPMVQVRRPLAAKGCRGAGCGRRTGLP